MALTSGSKLGPYEIQAPLGAGGMGEVYRARDTRLGRDVAIKIIPAHLSANLDLKQRLEREAKTISSLNHPHICTLHDVGSQNSTDFLVMEFLDGETLADCLLRGPLALGPALKVAIEIADALDKAHSRGIIHRDLKPGNIMLTKNGSKLMDFGLAKPVSTIVAAIGADGRLTPSTPTMSLASLSAPASPLTEKGKIVGTFQYMAPEVLQGQEADARSDIFSFGCVLYEMVTGHHAFEGKSQLSVLAAILEKEPERVSALQPSSPPRLDETVRRCLAKNPDDRYGCMHDVRIQLADMADAIENQSPVQEARKVVTWPAWLAVGATALIAIALAVAYFNRTPAPALVVRSSILPPPGTTFVLAEPDSAAPVLSPDGSKFTFVARDEKRNVMLYVQELDSLQAQVLNGTDNAMYPFWSPDSRQIGFFTVDGKMKRISANGGPPQVICDAAVGRGGTWN
jgi:serine/threonine protein kinase